MQLFLVSVHITVCIALIIIVLLQTGKGADIGAVFGGSSQTLFGSTGGSTFFNKMTAAVAIIFMLTSLILAYRSNQYRSESVMSGVKPAATAPAVPGGQSPVSSAPRGADKPAPAPAQGASK
jgi:preprotein translocase subunit SecG